MFRMIKEGRESHMLGRKVHENPNSQKFGLFCFLKTTGGCSPVTGPISEQFFLAWKYEYSTMLSLEHI